MTPKERLQVTSEALAKYNPDSLEVIEDMSVEDIANVAADIDISPIQTSKLIGIMIYIRKRIIEKKSRYDAFSAAFPERCIATESEGSERYERKTAVGEVLTKSTIDMKAKRLESSSMFLHVYELLQTNVYVAYALDRMKVLDKTLDIAMDDATPLRDRDRYIKIFLDETRKPEAAKAMEVNMNLTSNSVNITTVEDKMNTIAQALNHATAAEVIEIVHREKEENADS